MLWSLLARAWATRWANFGPAVEFCYPIATRPVSLTGTECGLKCAHCGGHYLKGMISLGSARQQAAQGKARSFLISGGCAPSGKVPFFSCLAGLGELSEHSRLNFHVGLVNEEEAAVVGRLATAVSFDFVGDNETIREVYGLDAQVDDYIKSYQALRRHTNVIPHICIGLRGGSISGEYRALEILKALGASTLVFIILIPTPGTRYENSRPPDPATVAEVLAHARLAFPDTPVYLGCMRPGGRYRRTVDLLALRAGVNKIVNPSPAAVRLAGTLGLKATRGEECCVL